MNQKHILKKLAIVGVASLTLSAVSINTTTQIEAARTTHVSHKYSKSTIAKAKKRYLKAKKAYKSAKSVENKLKRQLKLAKSSNVSEADIEDAEADVTLKESALDNAETNLKWANIRTNKTSSKTTSTSSQLQKSKDELINANKKLSAAKSNLNNLSNKPSKVINIGQSQLINFSSPADRNSYASSVKNRSYNNNPSNKNRLSAISKSTYKFNRLNYTSAPNDGYTNLTNSQYQELNRFALRALNAVRRSVGSSDLVLSQSAFQMSKDVAIEYKKDSWGYFSGHDMNALSNVSNRFGIKNWKGTNTIENMQGDNIETYRNDPYSGLPGGLEHSINSRNPYVMSMKDAKTLIYESMELLLFNGDEWSHAESLLFNSHKYFGMAIEPLGDVRFRLHIITLNDSDILPGSKFNRNAISSVPGTALNLGTVKVPNAGYKQAQEKVYSAKQELAKAESKVKQASSEKTKAKKFAKSVTTTKEQKAVENAKTDLEEARAYLDQLKKTI